MRIVCLVFFLVNCCLILVQCGGNKNLYSAQLESLPANILQKINTTNFEEKAAIGHLLFFDTKLSVNNSKSCASCHNPDLYFTDGYKKTLGAYADVQLRNTPSLINAVYFKTLNWADPNIQNFDQQMQTPLFSKAHFEMGMNINDTAVAIEILQQNHFKKFNISQKNWVFIVQCLSAYCAVLNSRNSPYDAYKNGDAITISEQQKEGEKLFFGPKYACYKCHGRVDFNTPINDTLYFSNINLHEPNFYATAQDKGLAMHTKNINDEGKYRIPSLRNITATAPYGHDGSMPGFKNLIKLNGHFNYFEPKIDATIMSEEDAYNICLFLTLLQDTTVLQNIIFKNPLKD